MTIARIKTVWSGGPSAPGLTIFNVRHDGTADIEAAQNAVYEYFYSFSDWIPDGYSLQVQQECELVNEASGALTGTDTAATKQNAIPGTLTGAWAAGVGSRIDWHTPVIRAGRRLRGRTFLVPLSTANFDTNGMVGGTVIGSLTTKSNTLLTNLAAAGAPMVVWARPSEKSPVGAAADVNTFTVPTKAAVLRGRRD